MPDQPRILSESDIKRNREADRIAFDQREAERKLRQAKYLTAQKISDKALETGQWIYYPQIKRWYTPQEFLELFGSYYADHKLFHQVSIKDPNEGIAAGFKQLTKLQDRLLGFSRKVVGYYKSNSHGYK